MPRHDGPGSPPSGEAGPNVESSLRDEQRRLQRLQHLAESFAEFRSIEAIGQAVLDDLVDGVKAHAATFTVTPSQRPTVSAVAQLDAARSIPVSTIMAQVNDGGDPFTPFFGTPPRTDGTPVLQVARLPLSSMGRDWDGSIGLALARSTPYSQAEQDLLRAVARMAGNAVEVAITHDHLRMDAERNRALSELLHALERTNYVAERAQIVAEALVPDFADYATVELLDTGPAPDGLSHRDRSLEPLLRELRTSALIRSDQPHSLAAGRNARRVQVLNDIDESVYRTYDLDAHRLGLLERLAPRAYLGVPLVARSAVIGSILLAQSTSGRRFSDDDVNFHSFLADSVALSLDNARLFEHEQLTAARLQQALLPAALPRHPELALTGFYAPGTDLTAVGGDWYDAFDIAEDRIGLVVGDIVGKGIPAAVAMSQLKVALRAYALEGHGPAVTMAWLHRFARTVEGATAASVIYAEIDITNAVLTYSCAGHPPPLLSCTDGEPEFLWDGRGPLLGVFDDSTQMGVRSMQCGDTVLFYTDGLIERRGIAITDSLEDLRRTISRQPDLVHEPKLLAKTLDSVTHDDDTSILTVTFLA